ncbi:MAG: glycosyltransferase [Prevotella sp.]|nr:glycosyltransferase [Prevotella sp.]
MKKNYLLIDIFRNHNYDFIEQQIGIPLITVRPPSFLKRKQLCWLAGCLRVLRLSSRNDTIICVFDFQAVICSLLCSWFHLQRKIICINVMLKDKKTFKNKMVSKLYRKAFTQDQFFATVTSTEYGRWLNKKLRTNVDFTLLRDVFHEHYHTDFDGLYNNAVFCGGWNGRDWKFMLEVAREMPDVPFNLVMHKGVKEKLNETIPQNVSLYTSISADQFYQLMCESSLLCLPLDTEAPAGLLVMFHAAANEVMTITTDTVVTREYISNGRGMVLKNDIIQWKGCIDHFLGDTYHRRKFAKNLQKFLREECSEKNYVKVIKSLICEEELEEED